MTTLPIATEYRYDDPKLPHYLELVASALDREGCVTFKYAAFGTGHRIHVVDAANFQNSEFPHEGYGGPGIGFYADNEYAMWTREGGGSGVSYWFGIGSLHTYDHVAAKLGGGNRVEGLGLAVCMMLVEKARRPAAWSSLDVHSIIEQSCAQVGREAPAFITPEVAA
jgi:hypothetical protein